MKRLFLFLFGFFLLTDLAGQAFTLQSGSANPMNGFDVGFGATPKFVDIDNDGDKDLISGSENLGFQNMHYFKNTGSFTSPVYAQQTGAGNPFNGVLINAAIPSFADLDVDGDYDAIVGDNDGKFSYFKNTGTASSPVFTLQSGAANPMNGFDIGGRSSPDLVDIDNDGDFDLFSGEFIGAAGSMFYFKNTGSAASPVFTQQTGVNNPFSTFGDMGHLINPSFFDWDNDGDYDAFLGDDSGFVFYFQNTGTATSPSFIQITGAGNPFNTIDNGIRANVGMVDLDGDGDSDAMIGDYTGIFRYYRNGTSSQPRIVLKGSGLVIPNGDLSPATSDGSDYANVGVGSNSSHTFTVQNTGNATLNLTGSPQQVTLTGANAADYTVSVQPASSVGPGNSTTFTVQFAPSAPGLRTASVRIESDDADETPYTFALQGNGTAPSGAVLSFDGSNDLVIVPDHNALDLTNTLTVEAWVKWNGAGVTRQDIVWKWGNGGNANYLLALVSGKPTGFVHNGSSNTIVTASSTLMAGTWTHIAMVRETNKAFHIYVNGIRQSTVLNSVNPMNSSTPLILGNENDASQDFNGTIDEVRIWNIARSCDEIAQQFNCELAGSESGLVAYYTFNQGFASIDNPGITSLTDAAGGDNNGTLTNFALTGSTSNWVAPGGVVTGTICPAVLFAEANLQGNAISIADGDITPNAADHTDFGQADIAGGLVTRTFTVENLGNAPLHLSGMPRAQLSGAGAAHFSVTTQPSTPVTAGSATIFTVLFDPSVIGTHTATLTLTNNDCDEDRYKFSIQGTGTTPGAALDFDGVNDRVEDGDVDDMDGVPQLTLESWVRFDIRQPFDQILGKQQSGNTTNGLALCLNDAGNAISAMVRNGSNALGSTPAGTISSGSWTHVAMVFDGTQTGNDNRLKVYINGVFQPLTFTGTIPALTPSNAFPLVMGGPPIINGSFLLDGQMDETRIWNRVLCQEEIQAHKDCELSGTETGLVAYYNFNQGYAGGNNSGQSTLTDLAGSPNNGTLQNFALNGSISNWVAPGGVVTGNSCVPFLDNTAPTITCPAPVTVNANATCEATAVPLGTPAISDNCGTPTVSNNAPAAFPLGTSTVIWTADDGNGNSATCTQTVTVEDHTAPILACPENIMAANDPGNCSAIVGFAATVTDNCTATTTYSQAPGTAFPVGTGSVAVSATDAAGNSANCSFTVTVNDIEGPIASCNDITVTLIDRNPYQLTQVEIDAMTVGSSDNCAYSSSVTEGQISYDCDDRDQTFTVTLTMTDPAGNSSSCSAEVTVADPNSVCNEPPTAVCQNITVSTDATCQVSIQPDAVDGGSSDPDGDPLTLSLNNSGPFGVGTHTVTLTVTDGEFNDDCTATLTVIDNTPPSAICQNVTVQLDDQGNGATTAAAVNNGSSDACGLDDLSLDVSTFNCAHVGANTVTLTVTDNNQNSSTCIAIVTVVDNVTPTAICQNVTVQLDAQGNGTTSAAAVNNGSGDACGLDDLSLDVSTFNCDHVGANTITLTVTDNNQNSSTCGAIVTVVDNVTPTAICQNVTVQLDAQGNAAITAAAVNNGSSDACGVASLSIQSGQTAFDCSDVDETFTVVLEVTDVNGNSATCSALLTISDDALADDDCDNVANVCDICPGGIDSIDHNGDGIADCSQLLDYNDYSSAWKCANNKINICHNGSILCINKNALPAHISHGDWVGPCSDCPQNREAADKPSHLHPGSATAEFEVFPNPASDEVSIQLDGIVSEITVTIHDQLGRAIWSGQLEGGTISTIRLSDYRWPEGLYFVSAVLDGKTITKRLTLAR